MKKLLFAVCALAAISLLAPSTGFAQWENRIGIYSAPAANDPATNAYIDPAPAIFTPFNIYVVLTNPVFNGAPVTAIDAFECTITATPSTILQLSNTFPGNAINVDGNPFGYAVGFATPLTVTNGQVLLVTTSVLLQAAGTYSLFLHPAASPSVPGLMAYNIPPNELVGCLPSSGDYADANPDFGIGLQTIGVESETFGGVKALFR